MAKNFTLEHVEMIATRFAEFLQKKYKIRSVYLYGSYVKNSQNEDSDIDIAVVAEDFTGDLVEDTFNLMKARRNIDNRIEPHPFTVEDFTDENPMALEVIKTGIRIV